MVGGGVVIGVSDPLLFPSPSLSGSDPLLQLFPVLHQGECSSRGASFSYRQRGSQTCSLLPWVLQSPVCSMEDVGFVASGDRPLPPEWVYAPDSVQTGDHPIDSNRRDDWMVSIDVKDAYLQVCVHPGSRRYLRFMAFRRAYHFKALCFGLSTAPQVFTRVMAPVFFSQSRCPNSPLFGRLADSHLVPIKGLWARTLFSICVAS